jgi:hypothetical protein
MANFDLLSSLAEIAGIFIGFGALIVLSGRDEEDPAEMGMVRQVVVSGLVTLVGALIPIGVAQFGLESGLLWRISAGCFFGVIWFAILHPTSRPLLINQFRNDPKAAAFFWFVLEPPIQVPLVLAMLGVFPERASGLYTIAVVVNLVQGAQLLAQVVYARIERTGAERSPSETSGTS